MLGILFPLFLVNWCNLMRKLFSNHFFKVAVKKTSAMYHNGLSNIYISEECSPIPKKKCIGTIIGCGLLILHLVVNYLQNNIQFNISFPISIYYESIFHILSLCTKCLYHFKNTENKWQLWQVSRDNLWSGTKL